jgi:hypothetical protein
MRSGYGNHHGLHTESYPSALIPDRCPICKGVPDPSGMVPEKALEAHLQVHVPTKPWRRC